jgi:hypothetical protein
VEVNLTVLENLPQHEVSQELDITPTRNEILRAIKNMAYDKAPSQSKMMTDMMKNLPPSAINFYIELFQGFWKSKDVDLDSWHITVLNSMYKGKGDPQDPNKH